MPYTHISGMVSQRVLEGQELRKACVASGVSSHARRAIRGHIYVTLYGMYERAVADCVGTALDLANALAVPTSSLKNGVLLFALHSDWDAYRDIGQEKKWQRGLRLLRKLNSTDPAHMDNVFPADGSFMKPSQLKLIWDLFELSGDPWPHPRFIGRIHELVEARNHVAHGSESAGQRGGRISDGEMDDRIRDVETLCVHIIGCFSTQLQTPADYAR